MAWKKLLDQPFLFKFRLLWFGAILLIAVVFLYLKVVPGGQIEYRRDYDSRLRSGQGFIYNFTPAERVDEETGPWPRLVGDPVYFSLFTPRTFSEAELTIVYRDHLTERTPVIEAGVLADNLVWRYDLKPLDNKILDSLADSWNEAIDGSLHLFQQKRNFNQVGDFLTALKTGVVPDCPSGPTSCLAVYNYNPEFAFRPRDLEQSVPKTVDVPLRGAHAMFLYANGEPFRLEGLFVDLNLDKASDPIQIILSREGKEISRAELSDDNKAGASGVSEEKKLVLDAGTLPPGLYKIDIRISDDVVIKSLRSSSDRFVFAGKLWPVSYGRPLTAYTDAAYLQAKAFGPASVQDLYFDGRKYSLVEPYKQFDFSGDSGNQVKEIKLAQDDVILENGGVFSFSRRNIFDPMLKKVDRFFRLDQAPPYILADYQAPAEREDGLKEAKASFSLVGVYREKGKYNFMISIPGLKTDDGSDDYIEIKEIRVKLRGRSLWQKLLSY